jgi:hypothetical protein
MPTKVRIFYGIGNHGSERASHPGPHAGESDNRGPEARRRGLQRVASTGDCRRKISPQPGTLVGVLELITDINGVPRTPVNVPLASLQVGDGTGATFKPSIVLIAIEPIRRLILP